MIVFLLAGGAPARGQPVTTAPAGPVSPYDGLLVRELTISGLQTIDEAYVRNQITTRAGQPYSQAVVQRDVSRLLQRGWFLDVQAQVTPVDGQVAVTFNLVEKPKITAIEFIGNEKFDRDELLEILPFGVGDALDVYQVRRGQEAIERRYREEGYAYAEITFDEEALDTAQRVVYTIVENQRVRVRSIRMVGNTAFSERELESRIATKTYIPIFRTGAFDPEVAERDAATLQQFYRDRGYLDAEVSYETEFLDVARERLRLIFRINEGTLYHIKDIQVKGNTVFTGEEILSGMRLKVGEPFNQIQLQADVKDLTENRYGAQGYIEVHVVPGWVYAEEPGQVIVTLEITEGEQFRMGDISVRGNIRTQEKVVRRELRFYPEEIYNLPETRAAEKRLRGTGLFTEAQITPVLPAERQPGVRDVLVNVTENDRTTQFIAGAGASSDSGLVGNIMLESTNFDLFDRPRSWGEFFRGRAFRGAGQTARIQLEPGTEFTRFRIDFREPYLFYRPIGFNSSLYLFERGRDSYDEERIGGNISFDRRFESGPLEGWVGEVAFRAEYVTVDDRKAFAPRDVRDVEGGNYLSSVRLSLLHDTTDSRFDPSEGHRFRVSWEQAGAMGGDFFYAKITGSYIRHFTVTTDEQDRKSVFSVHVDGGQILGDAPVFERFYAGGIGSFRGFDFRGISPRDGLFNHRVGGDFSLLTGAEYSFPLVAKAVRGVAFLDMGTVEENFGINSWRAAVGVGVRLTLDIFGSVPMEFDLALPFAREDEDNERIFSFFVGLPFL